MSQPHGLVGGSDGNVWFAEENTPNVGTITPDGEITLYPNPASYPRRVNSLALGPDGNIWVNEPWPLPGPAPQFGRITPAGVWTAYDAPEAGGEVTSISGGADGNVWFAQSLDTNLTRVTPDGAITTFTTSLSEPATGLVTGPDGALWFAESSRGIVGTVSLPSAPSPEAPAPVTLAPRFTG